MFNRRSFCLWLASIPVVGKLLGASNESAPINYTNVGLDYASGSFNAITECKPLTFLTITNPKSFLTIHSENREVARIGPDGVFRFKIDATDENAKLFVELIERYLCQRGLTGLDVIEDIY